MNKELPDHGQNPSISKEQMAVAPETPQEQMNRGEAENQAVLESQVRDSLMKRQAEIFARKGLQGSLEVSQDEREENGNSSYAIDGNLNGDKIAVREVVKDNNAEYSGIVGSGTLSPEVAKSLLFELKGVAIDLTPSGLKRAVDREKEYRAKDAEKYASEAGKRADQKALDLIHKFKF